MNITRTAIAQEALASAQSAARAIQEATERQRDMVEEARRFGATWTDVGDALGISKQAAWERFHHGDEGTRAERYRLRRLAEQQEAHTRMFRNVRQPPPQARR